MNYNFTDRTRKVLAMAREAAMRLGHSRMGPEHMLLGMVREGEGVAVAALANLGVDRRRVLERVAPDRHRFGRQPDGKALGELGYSAAGKKVLEHAITAAQEIGHPYVGTEHLLLGILRVEEESGPSVLNGFGVTLEKGRAEILRLLGSRHPTEEDPAALATLLRPIVGLAQQMGVKADDLRAALARVMAEVYEESP